VADDSTQLGQAHVDVDARFDKLEKSLDKNKGFVKGQLDSLGKEVGGMVGKIAAGFTLGSLITKGISGMAAFGAEAVNAAGDLVDLSNKTGASIEWLQRAGFVARQTGGDVNTLTDAVFKLGINVAKGTEAVQGGLEDLGLEWAKIKNLKPEEQFDTIAASLKRIENPQERNRIALEVFGKSAAKVLPAILDDYIRLRDEAPVVADAQILALDRAADRWDKFKDQVQASTASMMGQAVLDAESAISGWSKLFEHVGLMVGSFRGGTTEMFNRLKARSEAEAAALAAVKAKADALKNEAIPAEQSYSEQLAESNQRLKDLTAEERKQINAAITLGTKTEELGNRFGLTANEVDLYKKRLSEAKKGTGDLESESKKLQDRIKGLADQFGKDITNEGLAYAGALESIGGVQKLTNKELEQFAEVLNDAYQKMKLLGQNSGPEFEKIRAAWLSTSRAIFDEMAKNGITPQLIGDEGIDLKEFFKKGDTAHARAIKKEFNAILKKGLMDTGVWQGVQLTPPPGMMTSFGRELMGAFTGKGGFTDQMGPVILQALTGGGSVSKSIGALAGLQIGKALSNALGGTLERTLGKTLGGALSSILPGVGALAGQLIGKGIGAIGNMLSKSFGNNTKGGREDFAKQLGFGDLHALTQDLQSLGAVGEELSNRSMSVIGRNDEEGNRRWMEDVQRFYENIAGGADAVARADAERQRIIDEETGARDRLQEAVDRYGFSIEELGPKWRQQKMNEMAQELIEDFTVLTASGIEVGTVTGKMSDNINEFIQLAMKTGSEVPEAMKPMLQHMIDMGLLVDEDGKKIESLEATGLTFSMTMTEGFKGIIDKLDELIRKITGDLTDGLNNLPNPTVTVGVEYDYDDPKPPSYNPDRPNDPYGGRDPSDPNYPQLDKGGVANWGMAGTLVEVHNTEAIMPIDRLESMLLKSSSSFDAEGLAQALVAAGVGQSNVTLAPQFNGTLANEMYDFMQNVFIPMAIRVLKDSGPLRTNMAGTLNVGGSGANSSAG